jgi:biofilm PGA synthesis N-glycosyltransferase PgaC
MKYVLITPAHNEARLITKTLDSVVAQTAPPERWIIVDDGSTDDTAEIVQRYTRRYPWIELIQCPQRSTRNFASKVEAFHLGMERLSGVQFDVIGNLDSDVTFEPGYIEFLIQKFSEDSDLAVAGTPFVEDDGYDSARDSFEGENYVAGPCQLFRYECFKDIGGYVPHAAGGIDWIAVMTARMKGWKVRSFPDKRFRHHRSLGTAGRSSLSANFSYGEKDYYLGNSPIWQIFRVAYRMTRPPVLIEGLALLSGYSWAALRRTKRPISPQLMRFHRGEQMRKLRIILKKLFRLKKVDSFHLLTQENLSHIADDKVRDAEQEKGMSQAKTR